MKINTKLKLDDNQYVQEETEKLQIVLHHTAGADSVSGIVSYWNSTPERVATAYIIGRKGEIHQVFDPKYWGYALAVDMKANQVPTKFKSRVNSSLLNMGNIGIELVAAGGLQQDKGKWIMWTGKTIPEDRVYRVQYRGYNAFDDYTEEQLTSLRELLVFLLDTYPVIKHGFVNQSEISSIFNVNEAALAGVPGIWSHTSFRTDKSDCFPKLGLILMLNTLKHEIQNNLAKETPVENVVVSNSDTTNLAPTNIAYNTVDPPLVFVRKLPMWRRIIETLISLVEKLIKR